MPVYFDKSRGCYRFEFSRVIDGQRVRATKLLPKSWSQAQADKFDRTESARLYAVGTGVQRDVPTIDAAVALYLTDKKALKSYDKTVEHLGTVLWAYEGKKMNQLAEVAERITAEDGPGLAPATLSQRLAWLRAACRYAWKKWRLDMPDPAAHMILPKVDNARHEYLTRAEAIRLARVCKHRRTRAMILIAFYSGMRKSEIWAAKPANGVFWLGDTKNDTRRGVPIHPKIGGYVRNHMPPVGSYRNMTAHFTKAAAAIGRPGLHYHDLRHSTASAMIQSGEDLFTVGRVLGHKSTRSTARYSHLATEQLATALGSITRKKIA